jgi:hypothetical protein
VNIGLTLAFAGLSNIVWEKERGVVERDYHQEQGTVGSYLRSCERKL